MSSSSPTVSVILPVYNDRSYLPSAVRSVLRQSYEDFELIIVDDGSTDGSGELASRIQDPRVVVLSQENRGLAAARNSGIACARGEFIALIDADDVWLRRKLEFQMPRAADDIVLYSDALFVDTEANRRIGRYASFDRFNMRSEQFSGRILRVLLAQNVVMPSVSVFSKRVAELVGGFDESLPACEDWDFWLRCAQTYPFCRVDRPTAVIRRRPGSMQTRQDVMRSSGRRVLDAAIGRLNGPISPEMAAAIGLGYFASRNMIPAARWLLSAGVRDPLRRSTWHWLAATAVWPALKGIRT